MCRNIRPLYNVDAPAAEEEIQAAALQYVRKISGLAKASAANQEPFAQAVNEVAAASRRLLDALVSQGPARRRPREPEEHRAFVEAPPSFGSGA